MPIELVGRPPPELAAVPAFPAGPDQVETIAEMPGDLERGEAGQQVACGKVTGRPEYRQPVDHDHARAPARARAAPLPGGCGPQRASIARVFSIKVAISHPVPRGAAITRNGRWPTC
jgi:hypothetical protein